MRPDVMILDFLMLSFKSVFSLTSFTLIQRLFSSSSLSATRVVLSAYLRLLIFLLGILFLACDSSSLAFHMMYSAYKLNEKGDNIQPCCTPSQFWNSRLLHDLFYFFLTPIQVSQEIGNVAWYSHLFKDFPQFVVIHTVKSFGFKETEGGVFLRLPCFLYDLMNIDNSVSCSSVSLKPSLYIWKFSVHVHRTLLSKPDTSTAEHHYCFGLAASILLELLIIGLFSSPAAYWRASNPGWRGLIFHHRISLPFHTICGVLQANYWNGLPFSSPVALFCQNASLWPICLGWPCMACLIASLSYTSPFTTTSLWSTKESKKLTSG